MEKAEWVLGWNLFKCLLSTRYPKFQFLWVLSFPESRRGQSMVMKWNDFQGCYWIQVPSRAKEKSRGGENWLFPLHSFPTHWLVLPMPCGPSTHALAPRHFGLLAAPTLQSRLPLLQSPSALKAWCSLILLSRTLFLWYPKAHLLYTKLSQL